MLFRKVDLDRIARGTLTLAFRRWRRPTVKAGGQLHTAAGLLAIDAVDPITPDDVTERDARRAGFASRQAALDAVAANPDRQLYRIAFRRIGDDPRTTLREDASLDDAAFAALIKKLDRFDAASATGPWTHTTLALIDDHPATRAADLADACGLERTAFKRNVRKLKNLGLTESLGTGYRLSPRGHAVLARLHRSA